jgi:DNA end-binding protein Ku
MSMIELDSKGKSVVKVRSGSPLTTDEIRKGFRLGDQIVVLERDEVDALMPEKSSVIKVTAIVPAQQVNLDLYNVTYFVGLDAAADETDAATDYHAVSRMIGDKVAIGDIVLRQKHRMVAIYNDGDVVRLTTLRSVAALNPPPFVPPVEFSEIDGMTPDDLIEAWAPGIGDEFDPTSFVNEYKDAVLELVHCKASGKTPTTKVAAVDKPKQSKSELLAALKRNNPGADKKGKSRSKEEV